METQPPAEPKAGHTDAHGRAALLLVESLIHGLTARSILTVEDAVSILEVALDAQTAIADDAIEGDATADQATALILSLLVSMRIDLPN